MLLKRSLSTWELLRAGTSAVGLTLIAACAPAPAAPTPQPAAAVASPVATAAAAVASPVATAAAALASPVAAAASPVSALAGASPVKITSAQISPTDTTIGVQNSGSAPIDLTGWKLRVGTASVTLPGNSRVAPGSTVTIHTANGTSAANDLYLGGEAAALISGLQPGATIALVDGAGATVSEFALPR